MIGSRRSPVGCEIPCYAGDALFRCMSMGCRYSVARHRQVAAADGGSRRPRRVVLRCRGDGVGSPDRGRCAVQVDLGATHRQQWFVLFVAELQQLGKMATAPEIAAADTVA